MNVAIIFPKLRGFYERAEFWDHTTLAEVDIAEINQLVSLLEQYGHTADYYELFYKNKNEKSIKGILSKKHYDVIAIFIEYDSLINAAKIALEAKRQDSGCVVVSFGYYTISNYTKILKIATNIDVGIVSLDDATFVKLVDAVSKKQDVSTIRGIAYRDEKKQIVCNPCEEHYERIKLPWAKRPESEVTSAEIRTINGCNSRCIFCEIANARKNLKFNDIRVREVDDVINEIDYLQREKGTKRVKFADETFFLYSEERRAWLKRFIELYKEKKLHLVMAGNARVIDILKFKDLIPEMCEIGFDEILIGVENLNQAKLNFYCKGSTVEQNLEAFHFLDNLGINMGIGFILFDPFVSLDEIKENIVKILENGLYTHVLGAASSLPFPIDAVVSIVANSSLYTMCEENTLITRENWYGYYFKDPKIEEFRTVLMDWNDKCPKWDSLVFKQVTTLARKNKGAEKEAEYRKAANAIKVVNLEEVIKLCDLFLTNTSFDKEEFISNWQLRKTDAYKVLDSYE